MFCNCNVIGPSRPKIGVSTQNPGLKFIAVDDDGGGGGAVDDEEEVAVDVISCRTLVFIVILLLFKRFNAGADDDVCKGAETSRTLCGV